MVSDTLVIGSQRSKPAKSLSTQGRHWGNHQRVVLGVAAVNILWLAPVAAAAMLLEPLRWYLVALAYMPLLYAMAKAGKLR